VLEAVLGASGAEVVVLSANEAFAALLGAPHGTLNGETLGALSADYPGAAEIARMVDGIVGDVPSPAFPGRPFRCEALAPGPDGRRLVVVTGSGQGGHDPLLAAAFDRAGLGVGVARADGQLVEANGAFQALVGTAAALSIADLFRPDERAGILAELRALAEGNRDSWRGEARLPRPGSEPRSVRLTVTAAREPVGSLVVLADDVTETRRAEQRARWLASYDPATGLPNRDLFERRADAAIERAAGRPLALLAISFERMPALALGLDHEATDRLALQVVDRLRGALGESAVLGRLGDGAFGALLPIPGEPAEAEGTMARIAETFAQPIATGGRELALVPTQGAALFPSDGLDAGALVRAAGAALERARERPTGRWALFEPAMAGATVARLSLEGRLRRAIDRAEFELHYQPQADADTREITGFEALVRWRDPDSGRYVPPVEFIPVAEDSGLILPLGELVLAEACRQFAAWRAAGLVDVPVSVNLSGRQLADPRLCAKALDTLDRTGLPANRLKIELTETVLFGSSEGHRDTLMQLHDAGIRLLLDDFGTGYSSLSYLKRFPIEAIKVDRSFIQAMVREPDFALIVQSTIAMAHALGMQVVAEGVETLEELTFLRAYRCDQVQGYLIAKPLPPDGVEDLLLAARG
jgi:EAL domain-containing protein (putative c-di-GMP-specific phosphodiesterase class I)/GGDEF domain-containing protein/PAS domain-containing protein